MGQTVFIGSCAGSFYALDRAAGRERWSYNTMLDGDVASFHGNVLVVGGTLIVGTDSGNEGFLYAFDSATGEVRWKQAATGGFPSDAVRLGDRLVIVTMYGEVRSVRLADGEVLWRYAETDDVTLLRSGVAAHGDHVFATLPSQKLVALDAGSGELVWEALLRNRPNTSLAIDGDALVFGDLDGKIHRLSLVDGRSLKAYESTAPVYGALIRAGDCLLVLSGEDTLACVDPGLERVRWSRTIDATWSSFQPLRWSEELIVAGTSQGEVHALRLDNGETAWSFELEGEIKGLGRAENGSVLYVGTFQGKVYAVDIQP